MAVSEIHFGSQFALVRQTSISVVIPEKGDPPYPVLYLLHGLQGDHTVWTRRTSIERYFENLPLLVVMPDSGRGWYTDAVSCPTAAHETAIVRDLIAFVDRTFQTIASRRGRVIGGLSMGGYGALKMGLKHPHLFCAAFSHSGALLLDPKHEVAPEWRQELALIFGDSIQGSANDILMLAERASRSEAPAMRLDCGLSDGFLGINREVHEHLEALGLAHEYQEYPGDHSWAYWDQRIQDAIPFIRRSLGIEPLP